MEVLKPIYDSIAFVGIHILKAFHHLVVDKKQNIQFSLNVLLNCMKN